MAFKRDDSDIIEKDEYEGNFTIKTIPDQEDIGEIDNSVATSFNTEVRLDGKVIPYLASCNLRIVAGGGVRLMLEIIPQALDIELKNADAGIRFAYQDNTLWHQMRGLIEERNLRLDIPTHAYHNPSIVTLCGSTRFKDLFQEVDKHFTSKGIMVLQPGMWVHQGDEVSDKEKERLDELHFRKIEVSHLVYVINPDGYIGESTQKEIDHAKEYKKPIRHMFREVDHEWVREDWNVFKRKDMEQK